MQWCRHSTYFSKQVENLFSRSCFKKPCITEITSESVLNFFSHRASPSMLETEIAWSEIWILREMQYNFNITFTKVFHLDGFNIGLEQFYWAIADGLGFILNDVLETCHLNFDPWRGWKTLHP